MDISETRKMARKFLKEYDQTFRNLANGELANGEEPSTMIDCSGCTHIYIHKSAWGEFWCEKLDEYIYDLYNLSGRFKVGCTHYKNKEFLNLDDRLRPLHRGIQIKYSIIDSNFKYSEKRAVFNTYEDFGEWLCRQFDKIKIIDVKIKE